MAEWIYESPDGGRTVTRRPARRLESDTDGKFVQVAEGWWNMHALSKVADNLVREQSIRHEYPVLMDLWDQYHTMLNLIAGDKK